MAKTVAIYGMARNLRNTPRPLPGVEVWLCNQPSGYVKRLGLDRATNEWTRYFNLHARSWIEKTYGKYNIDWLRDVANGRPLLLQKAWPDLPTSVAFPRHEIQNYFATAKGPNQYFVCTVCWQIALAIYEGFERIELWGFALRDTKLPAERWGYERPAFFYWVKQAMDRGIEVIYQDAVKKLPFVPGDPDTYDGLLYGYGTRPEPDWDGPSGLWVFSKPENKE